MYLRHLVAAEARAGRIEPGERGRGVEEAERLAAIHRDGRIPVAGVEHDIAVDRDARLTNVRRGALRAGTSQLGAARDGQLVAGRHRPRRHPCDRQQAGADDLLLSLRYTRREAPGMNPPRPIDARRAGQLSHRRQPPSGGSNNDTAVVASPDPRPGRLSRRSRIPRCRALGHLRLLRSVVGNWRQGPPGVDALVRRGGRRFVGVVNLRQPTGWDHDVPLRTGPLALDGRAGSVFHVWPWFAPTWIGTDPCRAVKRRQRSSDVTCGEAWAHSSRRCGQPVVCSASIDR